MILLFLTALVGKRRKNQVRLLLVLEPSLNSLKNSLVANSKWTVRTRSYLSRSLSALTVERRFWPPWWARPQKKRRRERGSLTTIKNSWLKSLQEKRPKGGRYSAAPPTLRARAQWHQKSQIRRAQKVPRAPRDTRTEEISTVLKQWNLRYFCVFCMGRAV